MFGGGDVLVLHHPPPLALDLESRMTQVVASFDEESLALRTHDVELRGTLYAPAEPQRCVLIAPAMGVPATFYRAFARYLAGRGHAVLTFDYAGSGASPGRSKCTLADWADHDFQVAQSTLKARYPALPFSLVAHSVGGQLFGLLAESPVERALFVASQSGYWRWWSGGWRVKMLFLWFFVMPLLVPLFGKLPRWMLGGGDIPKGVAMQWGDWGRDPDYVLGFARRRAAESGFDRYSGALRCVAFSDDPMAPQLAATKLHDFYTAADKEFQLVTPQSLGLKSIGHFGAFRSSRKRLWEDFAAYLESSRTP
jgi:predicted alpha/beta hydrolase